MTKSKCIDFVNQMLDRAGHDASWLPKLMPKCLWTKEECKVLEDDLLSRIPSSALPGGPAGAPAPAAPAAALLAKKTSQRKYEAFVGSKKSPGGGDAIFGWCDTLYNMAKTRFFTKIKEHHKPAPGMKSLPSSTGSAHRDAKAMNKWLADHGMLAEGQKADDLSHEDKIVHKMHKIEDAHDAVKPKPEHAKEKHEEKHVKESRSIWGNQNPSTPRRSTRRSTSRRAEVY